VSATARHRGHAGNAVATIGTFDGVHVGHQRLIDETRRQAAATGLPAVAVTFDRHPMAIVRPGSAPRLLTGLDHKLELLRARQVDVVVLEFDATLAAESAEDFVRTVLVDRFGVRGLVVGSSFRFGHRHRGDVALLESMGASLGFSVTAIELVVDDAAHTVVSSSFIRALVDGARLDEARRLLGREHEVRGALVAAGQGSIAIPAELLVPPAGEYRVLWSTGRATGTGVGRVLVPKGGDTTAIELFRDRGISGDGAPADLVDGEKIALRFVAPISPAPDLGRSRPTSRSWDRR